MTDQTQCISVAEICIGSERDIAKDRPASSAFILLVQSQLDFGFFHKCSRGRIERASTCQLLKDLIIVRGPYLSPIRFRENAFEQG